MKLWIKGSALVFLSVVFPINFANAQTAPQVPASPTVVKPPPVAAPAPLPANAPPVTAPAPLAAPLPASAVSEEQPQTDLLFIMDASGSMKAKIEEQRMIDWAKQAIADAVAVVPPEAGVGFRAYAHRVEQANKEASCKDSELMMPIGAGNGPSIVKAAQGLEPRGWTPLAYSLEQAAGDFAGRTQMLHTIILVSDGKETCGGDPFAAAQGLIQKGFRVKIFTIGFNVDQESRMQLESLAKEFGGTYSDVRGGSSLKSKLKELTQQTFLIQKKAIENRIRGGDSFATAVPIEAGKRYKLDHHERKAQYDYFSVTLKPGQSVQINVNPVPKCITISGNEVNEVQGDRCDPEAYRFVLTDQNQKEILRAASSYSNTPWQSNSLEIGGSGPATYYLIAGSPLADMHRDNDFSLSLTEFGDAGTRQDAGNTFSTALPITPGLYETNRISRNDLVDMYKIDVKPGQALKAVATNIEDAHDFCDFTLEVLGPLGEVLSRTGSIRRGTSKSVETAPFTSAQTIYLRIQTPPSFCISAVYSFGVALNESGAPPPTPAGATEGQPPPPAVPASPPAVASEPQPAPSPTAETAPPVRTKGQDVDVQGVAQKKQPFPGWVIWTLVIFWLLTIGFTALMLWKKRGPISVFDHILGWYPIAGSLIAITFLFVIVLGLNNLAGQIILVCLMMIVGGLGTIGGAMKLSGISNRPAMWWGISQLFWIDANLHWFLFKYYCALPFGLSLGIGLDISKGIEFVSKAGFANISFKTYLTTVGEGLYLTLGINFAAAVYLLLLWVHHKSKGKKSPISNVTFNATDKKGVPS